MLFFMVKERRVRESQVKWLVFFFKVKSFTGTSRAVEWWVGVRTFKELVFEIAILEMLQGVKIKWIKEFLSCSEGPVQRGGVGNQRKQMVPGEGKGYCSHSKYR